MAKNKEQTVTLFAAILNAQYEGLRAVAFKEKKSLAHVTREAVDAYLKKKIRGYPRSVEKDSVLSVVVR